MSYNILGINPFHNGSACVLSDGEIVFFLEEERFTRYKHDSDPIRTVLYILDNFEIDEVVIAGINLNDVILTYSREDLFSRLVKKFYPNLKVTNLSNHHHFTHITHTFKNSPFKECLGIVIDSGGSEIKSKGIEMDSIYKCSLNAISLIHSLYLDTSSNLPQSLNIASSYSVISKTLGFKKNEEGKVMGLSSYGSKNPNLPSLFKDYLTNPHLLSETTNNNNLRVFKSNIIPQHSPKNLNYSKVEKDLAWEIQSQTQQLVGDYIEEYTKQTGLKQVCCSGGYFLNCVANYYLIKRFPDIEFYFEPISHDGGTSIGAAKFIWHQITKDPNIRSQKTLYYGPQYSKEELLEGIKKYI